MCEVGENSKTHIKMYRWHHHCRWTVEMAFVSDKRKETREVYSRYRKENTPHSSGSKDKVALQTCQCHEGFGWHILKQPGWYLFAKLPRLHGLFCLPLVFLLWLLQLTFTLSFDRYASSVLCQREREWCKWNQMTLFWGGSGSVKSRIVGQSGGSHTQRNA